MAASRPDDPIMPIVPVRFAREGVTADYFSMVTTVGTPADITAQEIRLEAFSPVDAATEERRWMHLPGR